MIRRIRILSDCRAAYLEYLRNLTPQILLFAFILVVGQRAYDANTEDRLVLYSLLFIIVFGFVCAFAANTINFHQKCYKPLLVWSRRVGLLARRSSTRTFGRAWIVIYAAGSRRSIELFEYIMVFYLIQALGVIVIIQGGKIAASLVGE